MKKDSLIDAIGLADEKFIEEAALLNRKGAKKVKHEAHAEETKGHVNACAFLSK